MDAVRRTLTFDSPEGKRYELGDQLATLLVRPRGWHLSERHVGVGMQREHDCSEGDLHDPGGDRNRDAGGVRARMDLARQYQLDGVSLWAFGFDDDNVWEAILPTVTDPNAPTVSSTNSEPAG